MTLAERLSEFVRAAFTGLWVQSFEHDDAIAEIARLCRQQRWTLATWDIDRGLNRPGPRRGLRHGRQRRRPAGGDPLARGHGHPRRHLAARPAQLPPVPQQHRGRPGPRLGHRRRQDRADLRRRPLGRRADPGRAGAAVRRHRARPARPRPARADRPRRSPPSRASCPRATG